MVVEKSSFPIIGQVRSGMWIYAGAARLAIAQADDRPIIRMNICLRDTGLPKWAIFMEFLGTEDNNYDIGLW